MEPAMYSLMTGGTAFIIPVKPGIYPTGLAANAAPGTRARAEAEHKKHMKASNKVPKTSSSKQWTKNVSLKLNTRHWGI